MNQQSLGILGGGQLGRLLIPSALSMGINFSFLDKEDSPCSFLGSPSFVLGDFQDYDNVYSFAKKFDVCSYEIENINLQALEDLDLNKETKVLPKPSVISIVQDKLKQKEFFTKHAFPTSPFQSYESHIELKENIKKHPFPFVQKLRKSGYDGNGVKIIKNKEALSHLFSEPSIVEEFVEVEKELAIIVARNTKGEIRHHPITEMHFNPANNVLDYLFCPAEISKQNEKDIQELSSEIATALQLEGILAIELFLKKNGSILINEVSARLHNSGHYTLDACPTSQFEQFLRAILDLPLGETTLTTPILSLNILGEADTARGKIQYTGLDKIYCLPYVYVYLYGKKECYPYRKIGHINIVEPEIKKAKELARYIQSTLRVNSE